MNRLSMVVRHYYAMAVGSGEPAGLCHLRQARLTSPNFRYKIVCIDLLWVEGRLAPPPSNIFVIII